MRKKDAADRLYEAVVKYVEAKGGKIIVVGGVEVQEFPGDNKINFRLAVRCTGKKPRQKLTHQPR